MKRTDTSDTSAYRTHDTVGRIVQDSDQNHNKKDISQNDINYDVASIMGGLYGDGFIALKSAFDRDWVKQLDRDVMALYGEALKRPGGAVGRGPKRHYVEIHPEE